MGRRGRQHVGGVAGGSPPEIAYWNTEYCVVRAVHAYSQPAFTVTVPTSRSNELAATAGNDRLVPQAGSTFR